ncbi:hypothetical protein [Streptomyces gibsoniae]|uniref:Secreted protein n=1 Tax=Streptomyces gibsoniae TaxID=3075529 RepID=A0ABU2TW81_9ACTN|nr:hypothetical protein [Streptomyces sp. DSM 41699]MDT0465176.1 hypothetical protein [Streptomyces sp. DSM 41699]
MIRRSRRTVSFVRAAAVTRAVTAALRTLVPGGPGRRERTNHAGRTVEPYAGPASARRRLRVVVRR